MSIVYKSLDFLGFPDYCVGDDGSVWSRRHTHGRSGTKWKRLKARKKNNGYLFVSLHNGNGKVNRHIHRLVLLAFAGFPAPGMECCHRDNNRANNNRDNLYWETHLHNMQEMARQGRHSLFDRAGEANGNAKLCLEQVNQIRNLHSEGVPYSQLVKMFNTSKSNIARIVHHAIW